jgi:hypothetical protein
MQKSLFPVLAITIALATTVFAAPAEPTRSPSVGEFAVRVSAALGRVASDEKAAADFLKGMGVDLGKDLGAGLTEERASLILRDLGVRTAPGRPNEGISAGVAEQLLAAVSLSAGSFGLDGESPEQCLTVRTRGACVDCCRDFFNCGHGTPGCGSRCAKFCKAVRPPGRSPSDPG